MRFRIERRSRGSCREIMGCAASSRRSLRLSHAKHGFGSAPSDCRHHSVRLYRCVAPRFRAKESSTLNRMVLLYAVPIGLFAGTVSTRRDVLSQDTTFVIAMCVAFIGMYGVVFLLSHFPFGSHIEFSSLAPRWRSLHRL